MLKMEHFEKAGVKIAPVPVLESTLPTCPEPLLGTLTTAGKGAGCAGEGAWHGWQTMQAPMRALTDCSQPASSSVIHCCSCGY
jgi:hypothetical protein